MQLTFLIPYMSYSDLMGREKGTQYAFQFI